MRRAAPRVAFWLIIGLLLFCVAWIGVRAFLARDALVGAIPVARSVQNSVISGDTEGLEAQIDDIRGRAARAEALTSDPIWRAVELIPFVGENLQAVRLTAAVASDVADDALPAMAELAQSFSLDSLRPQNSTIDLDPLIAAAPLLNEADLALDAASSEASKIDTSATVQPVRDAVGQFVGLVDQTHEAIATINATLKLLPGMLGADGPRSYLLLSINNAELRATGGIPGAIAVITADHGTIRLGTTTSATALGEFASPVLPVTEGERALYEEKIALFMQDVTFTPDFERSAELAQAMWRERTGQVVDGVLAIDPVALSYFLRATGPITLDDGSQLNDENAVTTLLSSVYSTIPEPSDQDVYFAQVTSRIFEAVTSGVTDKRAFLDAVSQAGVERRIHIWSAIPEEQAQLSESTVSGAIPTSSPSASSFGVYFNDGTGAKMDYYLHSSIEVSTGVCGELDGRPTYGLRVDLTSTAPADAATALPVYVTGGGVFGVPPGTIRTNVYIYGPPDAIAYSFERDDVEYGFLATSHDEFSVVGVTAELKPGESTSLYFRFISPPDAPRELALEHTPMVSEVPITVEAAPACPVDVSAVDGQS